MKTFLGLEPSKSLEAIGALPLGPMEMQPWTLGRGLSIRVEGDFIFLLYLLFYLNL